METNIYEIAEIEGKGVGFVASRDIEKGTVILKEEPQFSVKGDRSEWMKDTTFGKADWLISMMKAYKIQMNPTEKEDFLKLRHDAPLELRQCLNKILKEKFSSNKSKKIYGNPDKIRNIFYILEANGYCISNTTYLALQSAKINHSCLPNAQRTHFGKTGSFEIMAVTDIKQGEEITISYTWSIGMKNRNIRQEILRNRYHFTCCCQFCKEEESDDSAGIYKKFEEWVNGVEDVRLQVAHAKRKPTTEELKTVLISLKQMYELGKSKNLDPAGLYELCNEGFIASFKIVCNEIIDDKFKTDAKQFAIEGEKLQKLYGFREPELGEWKKRQNVDEMIDILIEKNEKESADR